MTSIGNQQSRDDLWRRLKENRDKNGNENQSLQAKQQWDLLVIGGGIVGAAILREAARLKLKVLLVEQQDFAWGTSSRSSKMVHGGLRYIASGDLKITRESVHERQRLLKEAPGLVQPMQYLFADRKWHFPGRWVFTILLWIYDLFAGKADHRYLKPDELFLQAPHWNPKGLRGASQYMDAATDDARLVLRVLQEGIGQGGEALNYVEVKSLIKENGQVAGVRVVNHENNEALDISARVVVNATGAWADALRGDALQDDKASGKKPEKKIRPLRGSHLQLPYWRLPVSQSITLMHPRDRRPLFIFPWEGVTVVGTTDLDHREDMQCEARMSTGELDYLFEAIENQFPSRNIIHDDVISTFAGVRPVVGTGNLNPSKEKRDHCVWEDKGLITVTGGKLTTFRVIALDVLKVASRSLPQACLTNWDQRIFDDIPLAGQLRLLLPSDQARRVMGRYGDCIVDYLAEEKDSNLTLIPGTHTLWTELKWAAANESVCHLDDLLLRRTRMGLLVRQGALEHLPRVRELCQQVLGWSDEKWTTEQARYQMIWQKYYSLPV